MENGGEFHLAHKVVIVVAGSAIAAKRNIDAAGKHLRDFAHARREFAVRRWVMRDAGMGLRQFIDIGLGQPDHMHQDGLGA